MTDQRGKLRRHAGWLLPVFIAATFAFFGAAGYAVYNGSNERTNICKEIKDLRSDVVRALDILTDKSKAPDVQKARKTIGNPKCP